MGYIVSANQIAGQQSGLAVHPNKMSILGMVVIFVHSNIIIDSKELFSC